MEVLLYFLFQQMIDIKYQSLARPAHEILVLNTYASKLPLNAHSDVSSRARGLFLGSLYFHTFRMPEVKALVRLPITEN